MTFKPFEDESTSINIDELTVENRVDGVEIYGSINLTRDRQGLQRARELKSLIDAIVASLEKEQLPDHVAAKSAGQVSNPFK